MQMDNFFDQEQSIPVSAFLRGNAAAPAGGAMMDLGNLGSSAGMTASMINNQAQLNQMNNLNLADLKRLQQLQQQLQGAAGNSSMNSLMQSQQNPPAIFLQNFLDQKIQSPRLNESLGNPLALGGLQGLGVQKPLFGSNMFQEHFMMNQNPVTCGPKFSAGRNCLSSPHPMFQRDGSRRMRGGVIEPFPEKLHRLLLEVEAAGRSDIISFVANGRAFQIHMPDKFSKDIVPLYFRQSRLSSFKRQLNLYGFELINTGPARGGYFHEHFIKDQPDLCRKMRRVAVKVSLKNLGTKEKIEAGDSSSVKEEEAGDKTETAKKGEEEEEEKDQVESTQETEQVASSTEIKEGE